MFTRTPKSIEALKPAFGTIPVAELEALESLSTLLKMAKDRVVMRQDSAGREVFLVVSGQLLVERGGEKVALVGPGGVLGEMALLRHEPRNATVTARTDATILALNRREFATVLDRCPVLADRVLSDAAARSAVRAA